MATLAVRPVNPLDLPAMRYVRRRRHMLSMPQANQTLLPEPANRLLETLPVNPAGDHAFAATLDGELCALAVVRECPTQYRWDVIELSAGSPRLDAIDDVCIELWTALLEYAIRRAGESGMRRLFAAATEDDSVFACLRSVGFEPFARYTTLRGRRADYPVELPVGMRPQEAGDVWSIHQLYSQVTPKPVQYAEALTSAHWELERHPVWKRVRRVVRDDHHWVIETASGIEGYCRFERDRDGITVTFMVSPTVEEQVVPFILSAAAHAGISARTDIDVVIPGYDAHLISRFERAGFTVVDERVALVRHTTVHAVIQARHALSPALDAERVPKGVPT